MVVREREVEGTMGGAAAERAPEPTAAPARRLLVIRLNGREHALPLEQVVEVFRIVAVTPLPEVPPWVRGVMDVRGRVIPVIDLRVKLGMPARTPDLSTPIVVVEAGGMPAGLVTDEVVEVLALPGAAVEPADHAAGLARVVTSVARPGGRLVLVLDTEALCAGSNELAELGSRL
jgi:purine-binding chemotaxis protein CheW